MGEGKYKIYPSELNITWSHDGRYWELSNPYQAKEDSYAELKQVCWLEVTGSTKENVKLGKKYKVGFTVSLRPDAFGWDECNVYIMAKIGKRGDFSFKKVCLNKIAAAAKAAEGQRFNIPEDKEGLEIPVVDPKDKSDLKLYFGMYEVWSGRWKGGLKIHHAFVEQL